MSASSGFSSSAAKRLSLEVESPIVKQVIDHVYSILKVTGVLLPIAVLTIACLAARYHNRLLFAKPPRKELYYPPGLPFLGHTLEVIKSQKTGLLEHFHLQASKAAAGCAFSVLGSGSGMMLILNRPEYIEYVQKTNFENFEKGKHFKHRFLDLLGENGIFNSDGHVWKAQRKMASHIFSVYQFRTWVQVVVHKELDSALSILDQLTDGKTASNPATLLLPDLFFRYTLSSFGKMAFGSDIHCLTSDPSCLNEEVMFSTAFDFVQVVIEARFRKPFWPLIERFSAEGKETREKVRMIRDFSSRIIDERLRLRAEGIEKKDLDGKDGKDLLDLFMDMTTDRDDLISVVLNFIIAGRDTTAQGLSWLFYELMAHPQYLDEIRAEVRQVLGDADGSQQKLNYEQTKDLVFLQACFNEAIRLHPPVPKNGKRAVKDDIIVPQGPNAADLPPIKVYAGEQVAWSDWVIARNPEVWGSDCEEFKPHRFIETIPTSTGAKKSLRNYGQWKFHVFNGGPRLCLGMNLANYEALSFTAAVIDRYDFGWATAAQGQKASWPLKYLNSVTHPSEMYTATVVRRLTT